MHLKAIAFLFISLQFQALLAFSSERSPEMIINAIIAKEKYAGVPSEHKSQFLIHKNQNNQIKTDLNTVVIHHGLYNSPADALWMAEQIYELGFHVINARLAKHHHEKITTSQKYLFQRDLDDVTIRDFKKNALIFSTLAESLGQKVIYMGHSTGGLNSTYTALKSSENTAGLILYAPAFKLRPGAHWASVLGQNNFLLRYVGNQVISLIRPKDEQKYVSLNAGATVVEYGESFTYMGDHEQAEAPYTQLISKFDQFSFPILWLDTSVDAVVDADNNKELSQKIKNVRYYQTPAPAKVQHNFLMLPPHRQKSTMAHNEALRMNSMVFEYLNEIKAQSKASLCRNIF